MNNKPLDKAKHDDVRHVDAALRRAAEKARELARQTQTPLVTVRDGRVISEVPLATKKKTNQ